MRFFLFAVFVLAGQVCQSQAVFSRDSMDFYLNKIDNRAVISGNNLTPSFRLSNNAETIRRNAGPYAVDKLLGLLDDTSRVLGAHFLLTKMMKPGYTTFSYTDEDLAGKILITYQYNGFSWREQYDKINLTSDRLMDTSAMRRIKIYWSAEKESLLRQLSKRLP